MSAPTTDVPAPHARQPEHPAGTGRLVLLRLGQLGLLHHGHLRLPRPVPDLDRRERGRLRSTPTPCDDARLYPLGIPVAPGSLFAYTVSLSVLLQVFVLPVAGAIADRSSHKKQLLALFAYIGVRRHHRAAVPHRRPVPARRGPVPRRQHRLRRQHRGLQLVPAAAGRARRARLGVQHRLGHRLHRRRPAAAAQPGRDHARRRRRRQGRDRPVEHRLGRRVVGRVHHAAAADAAQPAARSPASTGGNVLTDGFRQLGQTLRT